MTTIGFLHTADVHVATFRALAAERGHQSVHLVDATLLAEARKSGVDAALEARLARRLRELAGRGPDVIVCTCSTLGGPAERSALPVPVLRIDRPMAEAAVAIGGRIAVVAAVASTLGPTRDLLRECAPEADVVMAPCLAAWPLFEAGDHDGYLRAIAAHVRPRRGRDRAGPGQHGRGGGPARGRGGAGPQQPGSGGRSGGSRRLYAWVVSYTCE